MIDYWQPLIAVYIHIQIVFLILIKK